MSKSKLQDLISTSRRRDSTAKHNTLDSSTHSDRARVIYSASFRRLQQKAQVFSLESNAAVRSRLTHSIEVSHIGRYIVSKITEKLKEKQETCGDIKFWIDYSSAISNIVETACLIHDIGNPPFGHFGEAAIVDWAHSDEAKGTVKKALGAGHEKLLYEFKCFDGNPQGFRLVTRIQGDDGFYGLNLTNTQLASFLKYSFCYEDDYKGKPFSKKMGYFSTEKDIVQKIWSSLDMSPNKRHPLSFLMEAADDISYCISDIEDGIEKGVCSFYDFKSFIEENLAQDSSSNNFIDTLINKLSKDSGAAVSPFVDFKTCLQNHLVEHVAESFTQNFVDYINSDIDKQIISDDTLEYKVLKCMKEFSRDKLFCSTEAESIEISGYAVISGILHSFQSILELKKSKFLYLIAKDQKEIKNHNLHFESRLFNRLPSKHLNAYKAAILNKKNLTFNPSENVSNKEFTESMNEFDDNKEWVLRAHLIIDFISGMTDQFSLDFFQVLKGIRIAK
ncbi:dGTPase [Pseudidiomarina aestuarii]|uniref:dGTPase n=1 Tax=Pseudidiomarina aestuarii TaxID=624146 RepID=UPI003A96DDE4